MSDVSPAIDGAKFREVLGHFPTGVTVITGATDDGPVGMAIGSFSSVSLDPPLVAFYPTRTSGSWPRIEASGHFCVNVLADHHQETSGVFASRAEDKFAGIEWSPAPSGSPRLHGVLAWIDCRIERVVEAGDHFLVMGEVIALDADGDGPAGPLLFFKGGYGRFAS